MWLVLFFWKTCFHSTDGPNLAEEIVFLEILLKRKSDLTSTILLLYVGFVVYITPILEM